MSKQLNLSNLKPAQAKKDAKRVGRGLGSGKGRYAGRGIKGQKSRAGSHKLGSRFEGGQTPLFMRIGKRRGNTSKDAMPVGPFRTRTYHVNLRDLDARFDAGAEITPEVLVERGLIRNTRFDVKVLAGGELTKKLAVTVHRASAAAKEKIEAAGGTLTLLREPVEKKKKVHKAKPKAEPEAEADVEAEAEAEPAAEPEAAEPEPEAPEG
ncbi:MAG: 50S ribosomal protein L15 [Gaiellaceae bacterium]